MGPIMPTRSGRDKQLLIPSLFAISVWSNTWI